MQYVAVADMNDGPNVAIVTKIFSKYMEVNGMLETKLFEVRDRCTYIPVMATKLVTNNIKEKYTLGRAGYSNQYPVIMLVRIEKPEAHNDAYGWQNSRTMKEAHLYIAKNFDTLTSGDVVDVEFICGETDKPKISERFQL